MGVQDKTKERIERKGKVTCTVALKKVEVEENLRDAREVKK